MTKELIERLRSGEPYDCLVKKAVANRIEELERALFAAQQALLTEGMQRDAMLADNERLRDALTLTFEQAIKGRIFPATASPTAWFNAVESALAATPAQSLAHRGRMIKDVSDLISEVCAADDALSRGDRAKALLGVRLAATAASLVESSLTERDDLRADNERLREALKHWIDSSLEEPSLSLCIRHSEQAIAATPAQSLARVRNQVLEECIEVARLHGTNRTVEEIRARKEPE